MLIDGEKYACDACVRGHRVSTCQHADRPLTHINKKGRPVSQCPHCRGLRKARASHVACECGAKAHAKEDCETDNHHPLSLKQPSIIHDDLLSDTASDPGSEHLQPHSAGLQPNTSNGSSCCCSHGQRCTCSAKRDNPSHLESVPEMESHAPWLARKRTTSAPKPRLMKTGSSETNLTVFTNGHHKPAHKHNDSAHQCGMPYKIPIPHSIHGNADVARRSTDSLPIFRKRVDEQHAQLHESIASAQQESRLVRSEHGSPEPGAVLLRDSDLPALDLSYMPPSPGTPSRYEDAYLRSPSAYNTGFYPVADSPVGGPNSVIDWSALELNGAYASAFSQPPSYVTYEQNNVVPSGLTTSSSGGVSESGDYLSHQASSRAQPQPQSQTQTQQQQPSLFRQDLAATSAETRALNRLSSSSYTSMPQLALLSTGPSNADLPTSPPDLDFHRATASPSDFDETSTNNDMANNPNNRSSSANLSTGNLTQNPSSASSNLDPNTSHTNLAELATDLDFQHRTTASPTEFYDENGLRPSLHADVWERHGFTVHDAQKLAHPETPTEAMGGLSVMQAPVFPGVLNGVHPSSRGRLKEEDGSRQQLQKQTERGGDSTGKGNAWTAGMGASKTGLEGNDAFNSLALPTGMGSFSGISGLDGMSGMGMSVNGTGGGMVGGDVDAENGGATGVGVGVGADW